MATTPRPARKRRFRIVELIVAALILVIAAGGPLLMNYWPFRYREVHPLLEQTFRSRVDVGHYHRTYFPHPGYVAENITFHRHGDMQIPALATVQRMTVTGTWTNLLFHPHKLYQIRLDGLHVQIPPPGTVARGMDFDQGVISASKQEIEIETILADSTILDFLNHGAPPLRFQFAHLEVHNVQQNRPLTFSARVLLPQPKGTVLASGTLGPFRTTDYGSTPLSGNYSLPDADLSSIRGISGHAAASGQYHGTFSQLDVQGQAAMPDFRAASAHSVRFDAGYHVTVTGTNGDVQIHEAHVRTGHSLISASGSVTGSPKTVALNLATDNSRVEELLPIVQQGPPSVAGSVSFHAAVKYPEGQGRFLERLDLKGNVALAQVRFVSTQTQQDLDAFSARVRSDPPNPTPGVAARNAPHSAAPPQNGSADAPPDIRAQASSDTAFHRGIASFPNIRAGFPGAQASLSGTFGLLDTKIHLTGQVALEQDLSHATTGWKSVLLKPLAPFFRHKNTGALVSIAVTGTAKHPQVGENILHDK